MKEVAKKANVSVATVSAVINDNKFVSEELKNRIEQAIIELNYRPNRFAQGLKGKKTKLIGVTVTELTNPFYPNMLKQVEELSYKDGYNLILSTTGDNEDKEAKLLQSMIDLNVDGLILSTIDSEDSKILKLVEKADIPFVLINRAPAEFSHNKVSVDSFKVGNIATEHLISLGHHKIAFFGGQRQNSIERQIGFRRTLEKHGIELEDRFNIDASYDFELAYEKAKQLLTEKNPPTAVFAASDTMAYGVVKACIDLNISIPKELSVIGSDNVPFSEDFRIPLTTVDVHGERMGAQGFELLHENIEQPKEFKPQQISIEPSLVIRESTAEK
ncbi:LacI family DNA-binding transcriptional regulator [Alteribacillus sp. JSM 102045]|uniref:LacI family DNA-binding transcriptional regulator n=1 Tax=Alteribacillus sp. JSM 102045 TaxID=1562101 RepID=UPI0035BF5355